MTRTRFFTRAALGVAIAFAVAELSLGMLESRLPEPVEWYGPTAQAKVLQMDRKARSGERSDVVFVGPSTVYRGVDTDLFERIDPHGRSAYNAGLSGGFPPVMRRWVTEEIEPRLKPRTVVYGLTSLDFHDRIFRGSLDAYRTARATRKGVLASGERLLARHLRLFKYRKLIEDPTEWEYVKNVAGGTARGRVEREIEKLSSRGFDPKEPTPLEKRTPVDRAILRGFDIGPQGTRNVKQTVSQLKARDINVVLVDMPVPDRWRELHPKGTANYARYERHVRSLAQQLNVELLRPPPRLRDTQLYADNLHLNKQGARELTKWLTGNLDITEGGPRRGVPYATRDGQILKLDIFGSMPGEQKPALVVMHGGLWSRDASDLWMPYVRRFVKEGYLVFVPRVRLARPDGSGRFPTSVEDLDDAIEWVREHAETYGGDPGRVGLIGSSSGAHLTLMSAGTGESRPDTAVAYSPSIDLADLHRQNKTRRGISKYLGCFPDQCPRTYRRASPLFAMDAKTPPTLVVYGRDEFLPRSHAARLDDELRSLDVEIELLEVDTGLHGIKLVPLTMPELLRYLATTLTP